MCFSKGDAGIPYIETATYLYVLNRDLEILFVNSMARLLGLSQRCVQSSSEN